MLMFPIVFVTYLGFTVGILGAAGSKEHGDGATHTAAPRNPDDPAMGDRA